LDKPDVVYARGLIRDLSVLTTSPQAYPESERQELIEELYIECRRFTTYCKRLQLTARDTDPTIQNLRVVLVGLQNILSP